MALPTLLWQAYQANPTSAFTIRLSDGRAISLRSWSDFYYCWHDRKVVCIQEQGSVGCSAERIESVEPVAASSPESTILEQLRRLSCSGVFVPFTLRTYLGSSYRISTRGSFRLNTAGTVVAVRISDGVGGHRIDLIDTQRIAAIGLPNENTGHALKRLIELVNTQPFVPFRVHFTDGSSISAYHRCDVLFSEEYICYGEGTTESGAWKSIECMHIEFVERLELLPQAPFCPPNTSDSAPRQSANNQAPREAIDRPPPASA